MAWLFVLAAVMYVDDTDMLHWPPSPHTSSSEELIEHVQQATTDWGNLTQASSGILKARKCSTYFMDYIFIRCHAKMKSLCDLPEPTQYISEGGSLFPLHITIPQPVGPDAPIITHNVTTVSNVLGVDFSPAGNSTTHMERMVQKFLN